MPFQQYSNLADEQVILKIREGEELAVDYLLEKYKGTVRQKASALFLIGGDRDDLIQEGMIGLYRAIRDYDVKKEASFYQFAQLCMTRQMYTAIKASNRKKNIPLNTYISFYSPVGDHENELEDVISVHDVVNPKHSNNPEEMLIDKENTTRIEQELGKRLSALEREVTRLFVSGLKYTEIAEVLGKEPKSIDNALQRIRAKVNQIIKEASYI